MAAALQEAGSNRIRYTEYPAGTYEDGHLIASGVYAEDELLPWLFEQRIEKDTAELSNAISQAEQKNPADYTAESYRQFSEALMNAKEVLSDDSAQQEQIDDERSSRAVREKAQRTFKTKAYGSSADFRYNP